MRFLKPATSLQAAGSPTPAAARRGQRRISGDISIISQALNNMPPDGCPLEELGLAVLCAAEPAKPAKLAKPAKKKRAFTSPYHEFCQLRRPFVPASLNNQEREKFLGMAWKTKLADEKRARIHAIQQRFSTHAPAPQSQLRAAPPARQLVVGQGDPAAPHCWITLAVTDGMLRVGQIILERSDGEALRFALPPDARPGQCLIVNLPPGVAHGQTLRVHCQPPPAPCQPLLDPLLPPYPPMSLQTLLPPAAPPPAIAVPPKPRRRAPEPKRQPTPSASGLGFGPADDVDGGAVWYGGEEAFEELLGYALTSSPEG